MCGLLYARSKDDTTPVNKIIKKRYWNQHLRGVQGFGIYDGQHQHMIKEVTERRFIKWLNKHRSSEILAHHRRPTSTENVKNAAHPFSTKNYFGNTEYILIHNGHINNSEALAGKHKFKGGIHYTSVQDDDAFNDSEALLWDIALTLEGRQDAPEAVGNTAFICIEKHKDDPKENKLHYYRNSGSPLFTANNKKTDILISQPTGSEKAELVTQDRLFSYSYESDTTSGRDFKVATDYKMLPDQIPEGYFKSKEENKSEFNPHPVTPFKYSGGTIEEIVEGEDQTVYNSKELIMDTLTDDEKKTFLSYHPDDTPAQKGMSDFQAKIEAAEVEADKEYQRQVELYSDTRQLKKDFQAACLEYLSYTNGYYQSAINLMRAEILKLDKKPYNIDQWYDTVVIEGAIAILIADPFWSNGEASFRHPDFVEQKATPTQEEFPFPVNAELVFKDVSNEFKENEKPVITLESTSQILDGDSKPFDKPGPVSVGEVLTNQMTEKNSAISSVVDKLIGKRHSVSDSPGLVRSIPRTD